MTLKQIVTYPILIALFITTSFFAGKQFIKTTNRAQAAGPYLASDVLGQTNRDGNALFTKALQNNTYGDDGFDISSEGLSGLALDTVNHRLFVSDILNNRILVFNLDSQNDLEDYQADYILGRDSFTSFDFVYPPTAASFSNPGDIEFDETNNRLFVTDIGNSRVLVFNTTTITNGEDAVAVLGQSDFTSDGTGLSQSTMSYPNGVAIDVSGNRLFVSDQGNQRVLVFDITTIANGENAANVLGQEDFVTGDNFVTQDGMYAPAGLAFDSTNNRLFVAETGTPRVTIFDTTAITNGEDAINVLGQPDFTSADQSTTQNGFSYVNNVAVNTTGTRLFVTDLNIGRVSVFDITAITDGENAINVLGQEDFVSVDLRTTQDGMRQPGGFVVDTIGNSLFVADQVANRVLQFDITSITDGEDAVDVLGQTDLDGNPVYTTGNANNAKINAAGFASPRDAVIDSVDHRLFVLDSENIRILVFNLDSNNHLIDKTPDYVLLQDDFTSQENALSPSRMSYPSSIAYDSTGKRLFVGDGEAGRVLVFNVATIVNGEDAVNVLGKYDFVTSGDDLTQDGLHPVHGLSFDAVHNRLFVSDSARRIMVFDVASITNGENATAVLGVPDFTTIGGGVTQSTIDGSWANSAYDPVDNLLFVPDSDNERVLVFDVTSITNGENAIAVLGQSDFTSSDSVSPTQSTVSFTYGISIDSVNRRLFVTDLGNNRVLVFDITSITNGENAVGVIGAADFVTSGSDVGIDEVRLLEPVNNFYDASTNKLYVIEGEGFRVKVFDFVTIDDASVSGTANTALSTLTPVVSDDQGTVTTEILSGTLPPGISFDGTSFTGTPTTAGSYSVTIQAVDSTDVGDFPSNEATIEFTIAAAPVSSGGGGGGGGLPPASLSPIQQPILGFSLMINNQATTTNSSTVVLSFNVGNDTNRMSISEDSTFTNSTIEPFIQNKSYTFPSSTPGPKTIYAKFYNQYGQASNPVLASITYNPSSKTNTTPSILNRTTPPNPTNNTQQPLTPGIVVSGTIVLDNGTIYLIRKNDKVGFTNMRAFTGLGYQARNLISASTTNLPTSTVLITSATQAHPYGSWLIRNKTIYYTSNQGMIGVPSWEIFLANGGQPLFILPMNTADIKILNTNTTLPVLTFQDGRVGY